MTETAKNETPEAAVKNDDKLVSILERMSERYPENLTEEQAHQLRIEREIEESRQRVLEEGIKQIPLEFREPIQVLPQVLQWLNDYWSGTDELGALYSFVMVGQPGTGKTHTMWEIQKALLMQGDNKFQYRKVPAWLLELEPRSAQDTWGSVKKLIDADLVLLDDLGASKLTARREEIVFDVIDGRYDKRKPIILSTNIAPKDFSANFGDRIASRLGGTCRVVKFPPHDFRRNINYEQGAPS